MAGIYIHIPFCRSRCIYCGFYSTTALDLRQRYVDALCREMELRLEERGKRKEERDNLREENLTQGYSLSTFHFPLSTIYLGGGTPSQLTIDQLRQLFIYINKVYSHSSDTSLTSHLSPLTTEVTIEVNPDDVTVEFAALLQQLPVNRVSMGIQTFNDQLPASTISASTSCTVSQAKPFPTGNPTFPPPFPSTSNTSPPTA